MKSINILSVSEARTKLPEIIQRVASGEYVVIVNQRNKKKFQVTLFREPTEPKPQLRHGNPIDL
ncbi:MAG: type II toxin-antitoxin system prevent-host-death family antitoxin [Acidobacteria bacterium]|nr:type II toxin-antitoxin system prevent-host-death family antitoxin [Acidobacteriota bacterium]